MNGEKPDNSLIESIISGAITINRRKESYPSVISECIAKMSYLELRKTLALLEKV